MFKIIKTALVITLVATLAVAGVFVGVSRGWLPETAISNSPLSQLPQLIPALASLVPKSAPTTDTLTTTTAAATQNLTSQASNINTQIGAVLGSSIGQGGPLNALVQVNTDATMSAQAIAGKSLEYARYLYCQQVIQEWEKAQ